MDNEKLASSFHSIGTDIDTVHTMVGLVRSLCVQLPLYRADMSDDEIARNNTDSEQASSAIAALEALTGELVKQWSSDWKAAGGR